ncbi:MAG TPA: hypothetical protein VFY87_32240 [Geminicoccaceae bacterium]|nr:hypothetical protein [Geminicoccaceae bacterium]
MALHTTRVSMEWYDRKTDTTQWQSFYPFSSAFFSAKGDQTKRVLGDGAKAFESCVYGVNPNTGHISFLRACPITPTG